MNCSSGKHPYPSHARALQCARLQRGKRYIALTVYRCELCRAWHVSGAKFHKQSLQREH